MNKLEILKWISVAFILSNGFVASLGYVPFNFILLAIGTSIWLVVGLIIKDKPLIVINSVSAILAIISYINN